jgi:hypothetical protein
MIAAQPLDIPHNPARRPQCRGIFIVLAALVCPMLMITPPGARAASYSVWACADGAGRLLTRGDWKEVRVDGPAHFLSSTCGDPPDTNPQTGLWGVAQSAKGNPPMNSGAGWKVQAAPGTKIKGLDLWWSGGMPSGLPSFSHITGRIEIMATTSIFRVDGNVQTGAFFGLDATQLDPYGEGNHWAFRDLSTHDLTLMAWCLSECQGLPGVNGEVFATNVAHFQAYRMKTVVEDVTPPRGLASGVEDGARITVPTAVQATATDVGSGVRDISLRVDGRVVQRVSPAGSCADIDPNDSDLFEYSRMLPCPGEYAGAFTLPPDEFADGERHVVSVVAADAAGQETVIMTARAARAAPSGYFASARFFNPDLDIASPRQLNGMGAGPSSVRLSFVVGHATRKRFVRRRVVATGEKPWISGRLTNAAGAPISGARVWAANAVIDGVWQITGEPLTTSLTGRVSGTLAARNPSRDVRLVYFPYSDSSENVQSPPGRLAVRASTTIHLDRAGYRNGDTVKFSGRITTGPVIQRKSVYLQVIVRGRWRTFDTTRADARGRWKLRYRFTATRRPTAYRFRALIPTEHAFPWAPGHSRAVRVLVTP